MAAIGARRGVSFACDQRRSAVTAVSSDDATARAMMTPDTCTSARLRSTCLCCHGCMVPLRLVACPYFRPCMHGTIRSTTSSSVITPSTRTSSGTPAASLRIPSANRSGSGVTTPMCALAAAPSDGPAPSSPLNSVGPAPPLGRAGVRSLAFRRVLCGSAVYALEVIEHLEQRSARRNRDRLAHSKVADASSAVAEANTRKQTHTNTQINRPAHPESTDTETST